MEDNKQDNSYTSFLGNGWSFPPEFIQETCELRMTADEEDIRASLKILLGTAAGERFMNPKYGLDMHEMLFEPMGTTAKTLLKDRIKYAILIYEPRINLISLELDSSAELEGRDQYHPQLCNPIHQLAIQPGISFLHHRQQRSSKNS